MHIQRNEEGLENSNTKQLTLEESLNNFFNKTQYVTKGPKFDQLLQRKGYLTYMMFTGSSGAGKTTQVTTINDSPHSLESVRNNSWLYGKNVNYTVATRYITRKNRASDNKTGFVENVYIETKEDFQKMIERGIIGIRRERDLGSEKVLYGFSSNEAIRGYIAYLSREAYECVSGLDRPHHVNGPQRGGIIIYSGNNDMYRNFDTIPFCVEHKDSFVHIHVQTQDNIDRFKKRSEDVVEGDKIQLAKRASDDGLDVFQNADIVVSNESGEQEGIQKEINEFMGIIAKYNENILQHRIQARNNEISDALSA